ncbi:MAG: serine--tRNA ligase [Isosphaera sp.]|nr:serine--tRNA ligase [Isosphaera sp.]
MIDLKALRENPRHYKDGASRKGMAVEIDRLLQLDEQKRAAQTRREQLRAEQTRLEKDLGPQLGKLQGDLKKATDAAERAQLQQRIEQLRAAPASLKGQAAELEAVEKRLEPEIAAILLTIPLPPDPDVPVGSSAEQNVERERWDPPGFDASVPFAEQRGFAPRGHAELCRRLGLVDFPRGVKLSGARSYVLTGRGMLLHQAILRYALDTMVHGHGFAAMSAPVLVREEAMVGTGFFPAGREQAYHIPESARGGGSDLFLTGTGEVGLMGLHADEILDEADLPLRYVTVSTCFRREAGAAGKDTAGLYRVHVFDKVEQVVICRADQAESRAWHARMIGYVQGLLRSLGLPHRLLQCCTGDLGVKNADMIDVECWMPGRAVEGAPASGYGETHSASRLYDYQCRRLNTRYRPGGDAGKGPTSFCHSLNNTVAASPRLMIPILEMHQQADGTVRVPEPLRPYMGGIETIG